VTVYLGDAGYVELRRQAINTLFNSVVDPSDVNASRARFSFDFPGDMLITGDMLEMRAAPGYTLDFIAPSAWDDGQVHDDGIWFVNVDQVGGIRLYDQFDSAVNGEYVGRVTLLDIDISIPITVKVRDAIPRCVGQITGYEVNTARDAVDVSSLSDEFRENFAGMISGSGQMQANFDYKIGMCQPEYETVDGWEPEMPLYLHQLLVRQQLGSGFSARFMVLARGNAYDENDEVWLEADGVLTNAAVAVEPTGIIRSSFQFVTTGPARWRVRTTTQYILQESRDLLALERMQGRGYLEQEHDAPPHEAPGAIEVLPLVTNTGVRIRTNTGDLVAVRTRLPARA
jgi:hypothetical protein